MAHKAGVPLKINYSPTILWLCNTGILPWFPGAKKRPKTCHEVCKRAAPRPSWGSSSVAAALFSSPCWPYLYEQNSTRSSHLSMRRSFCCPPPALGFASMLSGFTNSGVKPGVANMRSAFELFRPGVNCHRRLWTFRQWKYSRRDLAHEGSPEGSPIFSPEFVPPYRS